MFPVNSKYNINIVKDQGFTLLEVIISVAVLSMIIVSAPVIYGKVFPSFEVRQYTNEILYELRSLRSLARQKHEITAMTIDNDVLKLIDPTINYPFPTGTEVVLKPEPLWNLEQTDTIRFFPSGASSGGEIKVSRGETALVIAVDWFSGRARILENRS